MSLENYIKKFQILSESKLGNVKPILMEEEGQESNMDVDSILEKLQLAFFGDTKSILTSVHDAVLGVDAYDYSLGGNIRAYNIGEGMLLDGGMADNLIISVPRVGFFNYKSKGIVNGVWEVYNEYYDEEKVVGKFTFYVNENKIELTETERNAKEFLYWQNVPEQDRVKFYSDPYHSLSKTQNWTETVDASENSAKNVLEKYTISAFFNSESINDGDEEFIAGIKNLQQKYGITVPDVVKKIWDEGKAWGED